MIHPTKFAALHWREINKDFCQRKGPTRGPIFFYSSSHVKLLGVCISTKYHPIYFLKMCIANNHPWMIFSAYTLHIRFKKSISLRWQKWSLHSSNSNNFATSLIPLTPPFKGFVRFIRYVTLHSLRYTSFVSLCFIRFALLCFTSFTFASFRQALPDSTRFAHSVRFASLHSFRFAPLIPFHSTHSVSLHLFHLLHPMKGVIRSILWSFFIVSVLTRSTKTLRLELYLMKETSVFDDD